MNNISVYHSMCCAGNHGDDNKTNNTTIPEWYFGSVALWHKNRQNGRGSPKGQSTRTALRLVAYRQRQVQYSGDSEVVGYDIGKINRC
jgi:hypothetical protein